MPNSKKAAKPKRRAAQKSASEKDAHSPPAAPPKRRHRKRIGMADVLRRSGLDEHNVAETYADIVSTLSGRGGPQNTRASVPKQLIDVLKECTRHLEPPPRATATNGSVDVTAPVQVQLVHHVERPGRELPLAGEPPQKETP